MGTWVDNSGGIEVVDVVGNLNHGVVAYTDVVGGSGGRGGSGRGGDSGRGRGRGRGVISAGAGARVIVEPNRRCGWKH
ncbi:hypothetical protein EAF00_001195 [Botryotinia globosa]|nr:hypothetical protein EAF00_001195 [Botryotinia globosa]